MAKVILDDLAQPDHRFVTGFIVDELCRSLVHATVMLKVMVETDFHQQRPSMQHDYTCAVSDLVEHARRLSEEVQLDRDRDGLGL